MMDTILNLGLNDDAVEAEGAHQNGRAYDSSGSSSDVRQRVLEIPKEAFEHEFDAIKKPVARARHRSR
jgi:hypothetical protein